MNRLAAAFSHEWTLAQAARRAGDFNQAFRHLERAHILGQRHTWRHVKTHLGMLQVGWQRQDGREIVGQLTRIVAAALFSRIWVPLGNTGGANVRATQPMPVPPELQAILDEQDA
ncbi:DUF3703 domain-containing protein [Arenimonas sp.]|jgi:hypothetical protein|uniref:DUF3703 domain-containing protein n=1 Tax=Arenimonas sp. TaxID=1872635 RepID=UPI0025C0A128|nr:DUF3703 domain-containing protein [Arenimonas sp.]